jgi:hypothetical protein
MTSGIAGIVKLTYNLNLEIFSNFAFGISKTLKLLI